MSTNSLVAQYVLVLRLVAAALPLVVLPDDRRVAGVIVATVVLALLLNFAGLRRWPWVLQRLGTATGRLYLSLDVGLGVVLLARLGTGSPFVLYTVGTAALAGLLFRRLAMTVTTLSLLLGYLLAQVLQDGFTPGGDDFHSRVTLPALYLLAGGGGAVLRRVLAEQERTAEQVTQLAQASAVSRERLRLSRDLHDSLTKSLHGLSLMTQALTRAAATGDADGVRRISTMVARILDEVSVEARRTVSGLRDETVDDILLGHALRARTSRDLGGAELEVSVGDYVEPPLPVRLELLAVVDEALENACRHAHAGRVRLELAGDADGGVVLTVADDGRGFTPQTASARAAAGHLGLVGMRERAERAGGTVDVRSQLGQGTRIVLRRPAVRDEVPA